MTQFATKIALLLFAVLSISAAPGAVSAFLDGEGSESCALRLKRKQGEPSTIEYDCRGLCGDQEFDDGSCTSLHSEEIDGIKVFTCSCGSDMPKACQSFYYVQNGLVVWKPYPAGCESNCAVTPSACQAEDIGAIPTSPNFTTSCSKCDGTF